MDTGTTSAPLDVIIVGGSIAGLFVGIVLSKLSQVHTVTIIERYDENQQQDQGAGIRLSQDVIDAITQYTGLRPEQYSISTDYWLHLSAKGEVVMKQPTTAWCTNWRQLFLALLTNFVKADKCTYRHGCKLTGLEDTNATIKVEFVNKAGELETQHAARVIGADGLSSTTRELVAPGSKREYVGYTILRGLVPRHELSQKTVESLDRCGTFCFNHNSQNISFWVPAGDSPVNEGTQVYNWGWYNTYSDDELADVMTDRYGRKHTWSLPAGAMREEVADRIRAAALRDLPGTMAEGVQKTKEPFVQVVTDMAVPENVFMNGKVVLIGDAVAGQRPHTASSCTQACFHGLLVAAWVDGKLDSDGLSQEAREYSNVLVDVGKQLGEYTQSTEFPPLEKAKAFFGTWFPTQAKLSEKFTKFVDTVGKRAQQ